MRKFIYLIYGIRISHTAIIAIMLTIITDSLLLRNFKTIVICWN